jgi:hypothetical protein
MPLVGIADAECSSSPRSLALHNVQWVGCFCFDPHKSVFRQDLHHAGRSIQLWHQEGKAKRVGCVFCRNSCLFGAKAGLFLLLETIESKAERMPFSQGAYVDAEKTVNGSRRRLGHPPPPRLFYLTTRPEVTVRSRTRGWYRVYQGRRKCAWAKTSRFTPSPR